MRPDVAAEIDGEAVAQRHDRAVAPHADLDLVVLLSRVVRRHQVLAPVLDPLHGAPQSHGRPRHDEVLGIEFAAHAEAAADLELDEVDQMLGMAEQVGQDAPVEVRDLGDAPEREHPRSRIVGGREPARLHRHAGVTLDREALGETALGGGKPALRVAGARLQPLDDVSAGGGVEHRHARIGRAARVGDDGQKLPVDLDQLQRVLGEIAAGRDHEGDRLADVADESGGEGRLQAGVGAGAGALPEPHGNPADRAEIVGGDHGRDAGKRARRPGADGRDPRVRMRRPENRRVQQAGQTDVGGVFPAPGQEPEVFLSLYGKADHHDTRRKSRAALPPRIAASSPAARRASRTTRSGSGSPIQKG